MSLLTLERRLQLVEGKARARHGLTATAPTRQLPSPEEARDRLIPFTSRLFPGYRAAAHHRTIAAHLEAVERGELDRLIVVMPPRHGKSELASAHYPAWYLGRNPEKRVIAASYAAALAYRFSRRARNLFAAPGWPFPDVAVAGDLAAVAGWDLQARRGGYASAGVGGPITGLGADLLLIDDPTKNEVEAGSPAYRAGLWDWFQSTALTRLEPGGAVVIISTRWHADDLVGRLVKAQAHGGDRWTMLHLPAINEAGEALWPARFDLAALERIRGTVSARVWNSLYQGNPTVAEGAILRREWWRRYDGRPDCDQVIQSIDTAFKTGAGNDFSVIATWGVGTAGYYLLDIWRDRAAFPDLKRAVATQAGVWQPEAILIEDAASGQSLIQELDRETRLPVIAVKVDRDKVARVHAISPTVEAGKVFIPEAARWVDEWLEEHTTFPHGEHDDQVDTTSMALARLVTPAEADDQSVLAFGAASGWGYRSSYSRYGQRSRRWEPEEEEDQHEA